MDVHFLSIGWARASALTLVAVTLLIASGRAAPQQTGAAKVDFNREIRPILGKNRPNFTIEIDLGSAGLLRSGTTACDEQSHSNQGQSRSSGPTNAEKMDIHATDYKAVKLSPYNKPWVGLQVKVEGDCSFLACVPQLTDFTPLTPLVPSAHGRGAIERPGGCRQSSPRFGYAGRHR